MIRLWSWIRQIGSFYRNITFFEQYILIYIQFHRETRKRWAFCIGGKGVEGFGSLDHHHRDDYIYTVYPKNADPGWYTQRILTPQKWLFSEDQFKHPCVIQVRSPFHLRVQGTRDSGMCAFSRFGGWPKWTFTLLLLSYREQPNLSGRESSNDLRCLRRRLVLRAGVLLSIAI